MPELANGKNTSISLKKTASPRSSVWGGGGTGKQRKQREKREQREQSEKREQGVVGEWG